MIKKVCTDLDLLTQILIPVTDTAAHESLGVSIKAFTYNRTARAAA